MSTRRFTATFLNGKPMVIRYNHDPSRRPEQQRVLFDVDSLLPVFGGFVPPAMNRFASATQIHGFVKKHEEHLNLCADCKYASCPCRLGYEQAQVRAFVQPAVDACRDGCFHHYCSQHVVHWLNLYLTRVVLLRERPPTSFTNDRDAAESFLVFLSESVYFRGSDVQLRHSTIRSVPSRKICWLFWQWQVNTRLP